jgi:hypothetical protein
MVVELLVLVEMVVELLGLVETVELVGMENWEDLVQLVEDQMEEALMLLWYLEVHLKLQPVHLELVA